MRGSATFAKLLSSVSVIVFAAAVSANKIKMASQPRPLASGAGKNKLPDYNEYRC
jgi:hypothetical protein